jgi:hypothetical protein
MFINSNENYITSPINIGTNVAKARSKAGALLGSEGSGASFSKNPQKRLYIVFILKKICRKTN